jgi:hypothetical protein
MINRGQQRSTDPPRIVCATYIFVDVQAANTTKLGLSQGLGGSQDRVLRDRLHLLDYGLLLMRTKRLQLRRAVIST